MKAPSIWRRGGWETDGFSGFLEYMNRMVVGWVPLPAEDSYQVVSFLDT